MTSFFVCFPYKIISVFVMLSKAVTLALTSFESCVIVITES